MSGATGLNSTLQPVDPNLAGVTVSVRVNKFKPGRTRLHLLHFYACFQYSHAPSLVR